MLNKNIKIFLTGHRGLVGSAILRRLNFFGYKNIVTQTKKRLDLRNQSKVNNFFKKIKPDAVINAAATVGGILANSNYKANFIYDNIQMQNNIIHSAYMHNCKHLIFLGSSCVYPKKSKIPIKENQLLTSELEKTNEPYSIAKISGIKLCESYNFQYGTNYKCLMPCNVYGLNDNYNLTNSHFFPALIRKVYEAIIKKKQKIILWGSGKARRELMFSDDLADACIFFLQKKTKEVLINIGSGKEMSIINYAKFIIKKLNANCSIKFDKSKPDGTIRKLIDSSVAHKYGWKAKTSLSDGFDITYGDFIKKLAKLKYKK